jgi:RNA polymerase sigma factor (sigma-70 family)
VSDDGPDQPPDPGGPGDGDTNSEPPPAHSPMSGAGVDAGEALFQNNLGTIEKALRFVCRRHRLSLDEAEDFASHGRLKLMENGYAVLRKFQGRCKLETFLVSTLGHALLDYRIAKWGRWRPSAKAIRLGPPAALIEQLLYRDGHSADEAFELVRVNHGIHVTRADFEAILAALPSRVSRRFEDEEALENLVSGDAADKHMIEEEERADADRRIEAVTEELQALPPNDRLLMKLFDVDGLTMNEVAKILGEAAPALFRRRDRIRAAIRKRLKERGFDVDEGPE